MIVLRHGLKTYKPRLTIDVCVQIEQLYGSVTKPLESRIPSLEDTVFIISLSLQQYMLDEDTLYEIIDEIENPLEIVFKLYEESGLINTKQDEQDPVEAKETPNNEEINNEPTEPQTFEQMCNDMLKSILQINLMSIHQFYASTLKEITLQTECYRKYKNSVALDNAVEIYQLADLTSQAVARLMSKDAKMPEFNKYFKHLLEDVETKEPVNGKGLTAEEEQASIVIREWAMAIQRKKEKERKKQQSEPKEVE